MFLWIWIAVVCTVIYLWLRKTFNYFEERGINNVSLKLTFMNLIKGFSKNQHMTAAFQTIYDSHTNERYVGNYEGITPLVMILDPELIKQVTIKDFDHFVNHQSIFNSKEDIFSLSLISLKDQTWRDMRSTLSPAFTGSKLRNMVPLIEECNNDLLSHLQKEIQNTSNKYMDINTQDLIKRYANDVIATCAFGLKTNSIKEKDNQFYVFGKKLTALTSGQLFKILILSAFPFISKIFSIKISNVEATKYFRRILSDTLKDREERKIYRPDMIQLLLEARKGTLTHEQEEDVKDAGFATVQESDIGKNSIKAGWDEDHLLAQAFLFFFAGFDTVSTALRFVFAELAVNTDVQEKLRQEIDDHYEKYEGKINYDNLTEMKYLDMIISETLRKWPPAVAVDRQCNKPYNLGQQRDSTNKNFTLPKDMRILIPVWPIHRDPKYYENPDKFDPERFSDENKRNVKPCTYFPFGVGPRNCIGSRFALVEMKVMTYGVIRRFEVSPSPSTKIPLHMDQKTFTDMTLDGGHVLRFKTRS